MKLRVRLHQSFTPQHVGLSVPPSQMTGPRLLGTQRSEFSWPNEGPYKSILLRGVNLWLCFKKKNIRDKHVLER